MCEHYGIEYSKDTLKAIGVFGGGIGGTERLCGAAAGAVCAIALKYSDGAAKTSIEMRDRSAAFMKDFMALYGSDLCNVIKPLHFKDGVRCLSVVETACDLIKKHME
ncbi:MAG: C-GCAxxG-C-C family protein [Defluviitaleaceae bacterium]|nr:C-GCAxxG-C-C family protein [Defluviitaleaceae bacterium]